MRSMMFRCGDEANVNTGNEFCCECNLCTMYACPEGLDPKGAVLMEKRAARSGAKSRAGLPAAPHLMGSFRRVPMNRLMQRLDLRRFSNIGPLDPDPVQPGRVRMLMQQHAGSPAVPAVVSGQKVRRNDCIAEAQAGISAPVHASINGTVVKVTKKEIIIQR
jgi:Na+-translocating ferredoxin:NAD+ oxidoreductase RnfC subunit